MKLLKDILGNKYAIFLTTLGVLLTVWGLFGINIVPDFFELPDAVPDAFILFVSCVAACVVVWLYRDEMPNIVHQIEEDWRNSDRAAYDEYEKSIGELGDRDDAMAADQASMYQDLLQNQLNENLWLKDRRRRRGVLLFQGTSLIAAAGFAIAAIGFVVRQLLT